eukprot:TRINITY_DN3021_c0_g1_i2.p1 TRINITY_DN3021_c0_g1~~TRINITY_DN3021_c0_g1_i2.p1  ORF type:complete len:566 (-),score=113.06 TRINITY_DN3021_c0_g1_i2:292-1989(-)
MSAPADWAARRGEPQRDPRRDPYASGYAPAAGGRDMYPLRDEPSAAPHRAQHDWPEARREGGEPPRPAANDRYYGDLAAYRDRPAERERDYPSQQPQQWDDRDRYERRATPVGRDLPVAAERNYPSPARRPEPADPYARPVADARDPRAVDPRDIRDPRVVDPRAVDPRDLGRARIDDRGRAPERQYPPPPAAAAAAVAVKEPRRSPSAEIHPDLAYEAERERLYREYETQRLPPPPRAGERVAVEKPHEREPAREWDRERDRYGDYHRGGQPAHDPYSSEWGRHGAGRQQDEAVWIRPPHERSRSPPGAAGAPPSGRSSPKKLPGPTSAQPCSRKGHEQYLCDIYCNAENRLVCLLCLRRDDVHRQHKCRAITPAPSGMRQSVVEWMANASKQKNDLQNVQQHIEKHIEKLQKNEELEMARLEEAVADLKKRLDKTFRQLADQAKKDTQAEIDRLHNIKKDINTYSSKIDETMGEVQKLNSASSIAELVHLKKFIALTAFQKDEQVLPISKIGFKAHSAVHVDKLFDLGYHNDELLLPASVNPSNTVIDKEVVPTGIDYSVYME